MCVGGVFVRENGFLVKSGGVDTLARIRGKATREKYKGNCTRPGMDVNSGDPSGRDNRPGLIVKQKSRPAYRPEGSSVVAGRGDHQKSCPGRIDPFSRRPKKDCWQPLLRWIKGGRSFNALDRQVTEWARLIRRGRGPESRLGGHLPQRKQHCSPPPEKQKTGISSSRGGKYMQLPRSNDKGRRRKLGTEPYDAEVSRTVP